MIFSFQTLFTLYKQNEKCSSSLRIHKCYSAPSVQFYFVKNHDNCKVAPELVVSKIILSEQQIKAFVFSNLIPKDQYRHLLSCGSLQTVTEVSNILKEFDALPLLETSVDNGAEENGVL